MRLIGADALDAAFTDLRFNADGTLAHWGDRPDWCLQGREVDKLIHDAPTIDAVPVVRGKWIEHGRDRPPTCSNCGSGCLLNYESDYHKSDYCPHCGADMREGDHD